MTAEGAPGAVTAEGAPRAVVAFAPGRVNLIGEHTDYNGGLALPFTIDRGITVRASALPGDRVEASALDLGEGDSFSAARPQPAEGWRAYVRGAVAELAALGVPLEGAALEITGTVPRGSGLSSSAALSVALVLALTALAGEGERGGAPGRSRDPIELARLCSRIENHWVGARSGLLDQLAALCGRAGHALRIDFRSLRITPIALPLDGHRLVVLGSGEERVNARSGYNRRRAECEQACRTLGVPTLREATLRMAERLPDPLAGRVRHVLRENARVDATVRALARRDWRAVGSLLDASHASLRDDYEVSTAAVEEAVRRLKRAGALGARILGGGFGGHVLGLLPPGVRAPAGALEVRPGPGARVSASGALTARRTPGAGRSSGARSSGGARSSEGARSSGDARRSGGARSSGSASRSGAG